jgi:hypothetical protein
MPKAIALVLGLLPCMLMAACAGPRDDAKGQPAGFQSRLAEVPGWSQDEMIDYLTDLALDRLYMLCDGSIDQRACVREAMYRGFDTGGRAREKCEDNARLGDFLRCIMFGSMMYDLASQARLPEAEYLDWNAPADELSLLADKIGRGLALDCLEGGLYSFDQCRLENVARLFELGEDEAAACVEAQGAEGAADCMLQTFLVKRFEEAVRRMGARPPITT